MKLSLKKLIVVLFVIFVFLLFAYLLIGALDAYYGVPDLLYSINEYFPNIAIVFGLLIIILIVIYVIKFIQNKDPIVILNKKTIGSFVGIVIAIFIIYGFTFYNKIINMIEYRDLLFSVYDSSYDYFDIKSLTKDYDSLKSDMFLGFKVDNNEIVEEHLCIYIDNKLTCLKAFDKKEYKKYKYKIESLFSKNSCHEENDNSKDYICSNGVYTIVLKKSGRINGFVNNFGKTVKSCCSERDSIVCNFQ